MKKIMLALGALGLLAPTVAMPAAADAQYYGRHHDNYGDRHDDYRHHDDHDRRYSDNGYHGRVWRDSRGRYRCRRSNGTTGLLIGGVGGALIGRSLDTRGDRTVGTLGGAAVGALAGRAIDRGNSPRHCR